MNYQKLIIEKLISKYENSSHFRGESTVNRRVMLRLGPKSKDLKEYDIEDSEKKELIHSIILDLHKNKIVSYEWEPFNKGNIMSTVWLNLENIESAYTIIAKVPKLQLIEQIGEKILDLQCELSEIQKSRTGNIDLNWIISGLKDIQEKIEKKKKLSPFLAETLENTESFLLAIRELCLNSETEILERVFSFKCFGDSKYFEKKVRSRLVSFIKKYSGIEYNNDEDISDEDVLKSVGILKNPEIIEFCGPLVLFINKSTIDFFSMTSGAAINSETIKIITKINMENISKVMFIENRSNFSQYINHGLSQNELIIYHGGFFSPARGKFFEKIYANAKHGTQFYHWGDIDLGGISIFIRLKKEIIPELKPYYMDAHTLKTMKDFGLKYSTDYKRKLEKALINTKYMEFHDTIKCILELGVRLEQEAFLLKSFI